MTTRKALLKAHAVRWNAVRKELRKKCRLAALPVERTLAGAVRAGILEPACAKAEPKLSSDHNRNPSGTKKQVEDPVCRFCSCARSQVPWRKDGLGQICKKCSAGRRKENRAEAKRRRAEAQSL